LSNHQRVEGRWIGVGNKNSLYIIGNVIYYQSAQVSLYSAPSIP
jgi:hypothetical protein